MNNRKRVCKQIEREIMKEDGSAAEEHLAAGRCIFYCDDHFEDEIICEWPDGTKELVIVNESGEIVSCRPCPKNFSG